MKSQRKCTIWIKTHSTSLQMHQNIQYHRKREWKCLVIVFEDAEINKAPLDISYDEQFPILRSRKFIYHLQIVATFILYNIHMAKGQTLVVFILFDIVDALPFSYGVNNFIISIVYRYTRLPEVYQIHEIFSIHGIYLWPPSTLKQMKWTPFSLAVKIFTQSSM